MLRLLPIFLLSFSLSANALEEYKSEKEFLNKSKQSASLDCGHLLMKAVQVNLHTNKTKKTKHILFDRQKIHSKLLAFYERYKKKEELHSELMSFDKQNNLQFFSNCERISLQVHQDCKKHWKDFSALRHCSGEQIRKNMIPFLQRVATPSKANIPKLPNRQ